MGIKRIVLILLFTPSLVCAGIETFECTVTAALEVSSNGEIVKDADYLQKQIGSTFSVERLTGAIRGSYFINNRDKGTIQVINEPTDNTYYVISTSHGPFKTVGYLYIGNYSESRESPFTYTSSGKWIHFGHCI